MEKHYGGKGDVKEHKLVTHTADRDAVGIEFDITDGKDSRPPRKTFLDGEKVTPWLKKEFEGWEDYPLQLLTRCGTLGELAVESHTEGPFSTAVLEEILSTSFKQYQILQQSLSGGSFCIAGSEPYNFVLQTPNDGGPFCSMALMTWGKMLVRGFYFYTDDAYSPEKVLHGCTLFSGWRSTGYHIVVVPVAFLAAHVATVAQALASLNRQVADIESILSRPDTMNAHSVDFGYVTHKLYECSKALWNIEQRAVFNIGLVRIIEQYVEWGRKQRVSWDGPITASLEATKNMIESQAHDIKVFPRRIKSQQTMVFNLTIQRDARLNIEIAETSRNIAEASHRMAEATMNDSASMKTIAVLTMLFLPGTAVASFFSMTMFNWNPSSGQSLASTYVWIYFVVAVPLTIGTIGIWYTFQRRRRRRRSAPLIPNTLSVPHPQHNITQLDLENQRSPDYSTKTSKIYEDKLQLNGIKHGHQA